MKTKDAISHLGSAAKVAKTLGISRAAVSRWGELVPLANAARLEKLTNGALPLDIDAYSVAKAKAA